MLSQNFTYKGLMKYFEELSAIPRASYHEEKIADYLCEFAKKHKYEFYRDSTNNVLINAPATDGCENYHAILLQGHTDMVCEKNEGVEHDFDTDGLKLYEKDGWIRASGTTLGADNGVAIAVMLYVLDGGVERHGALQCLFTASEEVGLDGVKAFDYGRIYARQMINMDSADETLIIAGCAGGLRSSITMDVSVEKVKAPHVVRVAIKGLAGGHSGEDIDKGRANANKLMGRVLDRMFLSDSSVRLVSVQGGTKDNAIPRECEAILATENLDVLKKEAEALSDLLRHGLSSADSGLSVNLSVIAESSDVNVINTDTAKSVIFLMNCVPNGVFEMNNSIDGLVEWSRNLGIVRCDDQGAELVFSSRSSFESRIDASAAELDGFTRMIGAKARHYNRYPGWNFTEKSEIREKYIEAHKKVMCKAPRITTIHAGLECGFISQAVPEMDILSCGPVILDLHSPDERLDKGSFERFYTIIKTVIEG